MRANGQTTEGTRTIASEAVTEGHPDRVCDQIADEILDEIIRAEGGSPDLRCACEVLITAGTVVIAGEFTCSKAPDADAIARRVLRRIGYDDPRAGADADSIRVIWLGHDKPYDTASGENSDRTRYFDAPEDPLDALRPNDQSIVFGYACEDTPQLMPLPPTLAARIASGLAAARHDKTLPELLPDGKVMVAVACDASSLQPVAVERVLVSIQHAVGADLEELRRQVGDVVIRPALEWAGQLGVSVGDARIDVNPGGDFSLGGPFVDTGLLGRKVVVDSYGGVAHVGGGALSGKDCVKVDRTGAYLARWAAKHVVAAGLARRCELQLAYGPGLPEPFSVSIDTFGTGTWADDVIGRALPLAFDFRPEAAIRALGLRRPIYAQTSAHGHFGTDGLPWEEIDARQLNRLLDAVSRIGSEEGE